MGNFAFCGKESEAIHLFGEECGTVRMFGKQTGKLYLLWQRKWNCPPVGQGMWECPLYHGKWEGKKARNVWRFTFLLKKRMFAVSSEVRRCNCLGKESRKLSRKVGRCGCFGKEIEMLLTPWRGIWVVRLFREESEKTYLRGQGRKVQFSETVYLLRYWNWGAPAYISKVSWSFFVVRKATSCICFCRASEKVKLFQQGE